MKTGAFILLTSFLLVLATFAAPVGADAPSACVYVSETSHNIHGAFSAYYSAYNGYDNFGPPLTEAFMENGRVVQYFLRARFEFWPDYPQPYRVQLGRLGELYGITDPPVRSIVIPRPDDPNYAYFPATGLFVPSTLKKYFDSHGGWELMGYPISNIRYEGKYFTQYFQRARLEWYFPDNRVAASPVGQMALDKIYPPNFKWRQQAANDACLAMKPAPSSPGGGALPTATRVIYGLPTSVPAGTAIKVEVHAQFRQAPRGAQYVAVSAYDQTQHALPGVALIATVRSANGDRVFALLPTDGTGRASLSFDVGELPVNTAIWIYVTAYSGSTTATGSDSFTR